MILYPSGESKTEHRSPPWATLVWIAIAIGCYVYFVPKYAGEQARDRQEALARLRRLAEAQFKAGQLDRITWVRFNEEPRLLDDPEQAKRFTEAARIAWIEANDRSPELNRIAHKPPRNLILLVTPHHWIVLLLGALCLLFMGYLLEHLYDSMFVFATYLLAGALLVLAQRFLPLAYQPSILLAWAHGVLLVLWVSWLVSPSAVLTVSVRGWFLRPFGDDYEVASITFPIIFTLGAVAATYFSPYRMALSMLPALLLGAGTGVLALMFVILPLRAPRQSLTAEEKLQRDLAEAELRFEQGDAKAGLAILHQLAKLEPHRRYMAAIANLAWHNDDPELAKHCYLHMIRKAHLPSDAPAYFEALGDMLFRRLPVAGTYVTKGMSLAIETYNREQIGTLMPYLLDHQEIGREEVIALLERLGQRTLEQKAPDRLLVSQLQDWFQANAPNSPLLAKFATFFQGGSQESKLTGNFAQYRRIGRLVKVDLLDVQPQKIIVALEGQKEQRVPWTAVLGVYGCHIAGSSRGFRGCIVLQFQRKIFGCVFSSATIKFSHRAQPVTFERVWELLHDHVPEDVPFMIMKDFPTLKDEALLLSQAEAFINPD